MARWSGFLAGIAVAGCCCLYGQNFRLISQNCLHLGWGVYPNKAPTINAEAATAQVTVLQEVMYNDGATLASVTPPGNYVAIASGVKGGGSYREAYVFIVDQALAPTAIFDYPDPNADFSRPPSAIKVTPTGGGAILWVADYHAVFGKNAGVRRAEVSSMPAAVNWFRAQDVAPVNRMIIGGDWNLGNTDAGFANLTGAGFTIVPNHLTSLTRSGGYSQPYDHFAYSTADVAVANPTAVVPPNLPWWRANVSDHIGISATVQ